MKDEIPVHESAGERGDAEWKRDSYKRFEDAMIHGKLETRRVVVRFNSSMGLFGASFGDMTFRSRDYKALTKRLAEHLSTMESHVFARYLKVDYEQRHESRRNRHGGKAWHGDGEGDVTGIYLEFDVFDVSEEYDTAVHGRGARGTSKARVWRRMARGRDGEWSQVGDDDVEHVYGDHDPFKALIPYTEDRWRTLVGLKESIGKVAAVLDSMFGDKALESGAGMAMLDGMAGQRLLPAPETPARPAKKGKRR